jgi:hypothetical protein
LVLHLNEPFQEEKLARVFIQETCAGIVQPLIFISFFIIILGFFFPQISTFF